MDAPGKLVSVGTHRLFADCRGPAGRGPAVVFDAALGASSISWALVQPEVAKAALTCSYDRAGLGRSEAGPMPRTVSRIVDELRALLDGAGIEPPFIPVGHSFGGLCALQFAQRYRAETAGLVLVDAPDPRQWAAMSEHDRSRLEKGAWLARRGALAARCGVARLVSWLVRAGASGAAHRVSLTFSGGALRGHAERLLAPLAKLPPELRRAAPEAWMKPRFYQALASQMESLPVSAAEVAAIRDLGDLPLAVLTAAHPSPDRMAEQEEAVRLSTRGRHRIADGGGHWIPIDEPALTIRAILDILDAART